MRKAVAYPLGVALLAGLGAAWYVDPQRTRFIGWGGDPYFNLWTFATVWRKLGHDGLSWIFNPRAWNAQLYADAPFGLAYSENQLWAALLGWPFYALTHSRPLALQMFAVLEVVAAALAAYFWLRRRADALPAAVLAVFFATSGWLQSQTGHFQNLCVFVLPLSFVAMDRFEERRTWSRALVAGAAIGWIAGWNLYYFCFAAAVAGFRLLRGLRARRFTPPSVVVVIGVALVVAFPLLRPYLLLDREIGSHAALVTYGLHPRDLFSRLHAPALLGPARDADPEPGGMPYAWPGLVLLALRRRSAWSWLIAAAMSFWISLGALGGAWQLFGWLPAISALRAIGRAHVLTILFSLPAIAEGVRGLRPWLAAALLLLLPLGSLPRARGEHVAVPERAPLLLDAGGRAALVLPPPDHPLMLELVDADLSYFGGSSGFAPAGEELLQATWQRQGVDSVAGLIAATRTTRVLARTPAVAEAVRRGARVIAERPVDLAEGEARWMTLAPATASPLPLDQLPAESRTTRPPMIELRAPAAGVLDLRVLDRCVLELTDAWHGVALHRRLKLQGTELRGVAFQRDELVYRHVVDRRLYALLDLVTTQRIRCPE